MNPRRAFETEGRDTPEALAVDLALGAPSVATIEVKPNDD